MSHSTDHSTVCTGRYLDFLNIFSKFLSALDNNSGMSGDAAPSAHSSLRVPARPSQNAAGGRRTAQPDGGDNIKGAP